MKLSYSLLNRISSFITIRNLRILIIVVTIIASVHKYFRANINNYYIFTKSFFILISHQSLYIPHPEYFADTYKYSPTFPLLIAPLYFLPDLIGLSLWNVLNAVLLFSAVRVLISEDDKAILALGIILIPLLTSVQNNQANALMAALIIFSFINFEKRKLSVSALLISLTFFIKIYGIAACIFAIFYLKRARFVGFLIFWFCLLLILPLVILSPSELIQQWTEWYWSVKVSRTVSQFSVMGLIERISGVGIMYLPVQLAGLLFLLLPLFRVSRFNEPDFRLKVLCSLLIFIVIFNQMAESPTYIIAVTGVAVWYVYSKRDMVANFLLALVLIFTSLSRTDLFPEYLRENYIDAYAITCLPCLLVWIKIQYELIIEKKSTREIEAVNRRENFLNN